MRMRSLKAVRNDAGLLWFACLAAVCAGYYVAFGVFGAAIDHERERTAQLSAFVLADARELAARPALERAAAAADANLRDLALDADKPTTVARFIHTVVRIAGQQHVAIRQLDERPETSVPPARTAAVANAFEAIPFELELSGTYGATIATIRELARSPVAMQIEIASLESAAPTGARASLTAHVHVALQRLAQPKPVTPVTRSEDSESDARPH